MLCAVALLCGEPGTRTAGSVEPERRTDAGDRSLPTGVRLPLLSRAPSETAGAFGFGPAPREERSPAERALAALADGQPDRALAILERGSAIGPDSPELRALAAAAHLARGLDPAAASPGDLVEALERVGRSPDDLPSLYNRALALEALHCYRLAAEAWERYLARDPGSVWGAEAAGHLERVREVIAELDRALSAAEQAPGGIEPDEPALSAAGAEGVAELRRGQEALAGYSPERALRHLERARDLLAGSGDPLRWEAEAGVAQAEYQLLRLDRADPRARRVLAAARRSGDRELEARCLWMLADLHLGRLDLQQALHFARERHALGRKLGDRGIVATAGLTLSRVLDELGDPESAWEHRAESFRILADLRDPRLPVTIGNSSFALARQGKHRAAEDFATEMLLADRTLGDPLGLVDALWTRARHRAGGGDLEGALADVAEADGHLERVEGRDLRARYYAGLRAVEGAALREVDPARAVASLDSALDHSRRLGSEYGRSELLLERARALRGLGRPAEAVRDLAEATAIVGEQRGRIAQPVLRVSFFDFQEELADEAVAVAVETAEPARAFRVAESAKGLLLRESLGSSGGWTVPSVAEGGADGLAADEVLIAYWSLPEELLIWTLRPGGEPVLHRRAAPRRTVAELVRRLVASFEPGEPQPPLAERAHALLLAPIEREIAHARRLVVVPDRVTRGVPWAALRDRVRAERVIERFVVRVRPTAAGIGTASPAGPGTRLEGPLLALGDPRVGGGRSPLPAARREVAEVAALFARATVLVGEEATPERFLEALPAASVVHLAGHFETGARPWSTWIPMAPDHPGEVAGLTVGEIAALDLDRLRLAVLSGCATQREGEASLEGTYSAAGAFLAAGADEVVASLWPVDDRAAAELMAELYPRLLRGMETDEALREAQLALLDREGGSRRRADWAAFQVISLRPTARAAGD